jgi:hypothetical protein
MLLGGFCGFILGSIFKFRALPFLKEETILSGGRAVPTADFAASLARWFYIFGLACVVGSVLWLIVRADKKR